MQVFPRKKKSCANQKFLISTKGLKVQPYSQLICFSMNVMDEKNKKLGNFFKLDGLGKGTFMTKW